MQRLWEAAYGVIASLEQLSRLTRLGGGTRGATHDGLARAPAAAVNRAEERARIRDELVRARARFAELMNEREAYRTLFPLVAHADEMMQLAAAVSHPSSSVPLQKEFFQVANAGDLFFESLDELLDTPSASRFTLEVYLFCLKLGFQGRYGANPERLENYQRRLATVLCEPLPERQVLLDADEPEPVVKRRTFLKYYLATALVLALTYFGLGGLSRETTAPSPRPSAQIRSLGEGR
jgi:type IV/VI secretion system ImpK/VasF family protein